MKKRTVGILPLYYIIIELSGTGENFTDFQKMIMFIRNYNAPQNGRTTRIAKLIPIII